MKKVILMLAILSLVAGNAFGLECLQALSAATDPTNGYLRVSFNTYDSTANTATLVYEQLCGNWYDATNKALAIAPVGDMTLVGNVDITGTFGVTGNSTMTGTLEITGATNIEGGLFIFNDDSGDYDFRVESNGGANAIFVDAGNDRVGIHTAAPTVPFEVTGNTIITGTFDVTGATTIDGATTLNPDGDDVDTIIKGDTKDVLTVDAGTDALQVDGFREYAFTTINQQSYSISATTKSSDFIHTFTDTEASTIHLMTNLVVSGRIIRIKDGNLNAASNNIVIDTEGGELIDEAATHTMNANGEVVTLLCDGTNWFVMEGYLE